MVSSFYIGLDLGQASDPTCAVILERRVPDLTMQEQLNRAKPKPAVYLLRYLAQPKLGTDYPAVVARVRELLVASPEMAAATLIVDATGVGMPVVDMMRAARLGPVAVWIHGGDRVTFDKGAWRVPKRDLCGIVQVLLQNDRLKFADGLPMLDVLKRELLNFKVKIDPKTAHDSYSAWRENQHDDMVLATALAAWYAEHFGKAQRARVR